MTHISEVLLEFLNTMRSDLRRRSFDETGEQKAETEQRIETLKDLIKKIKSQGGKK